MSKIHIPWNMLQLDKEVAKEIKYNSLKDLWDEEVEEFVLLVETVAGNHYGTEDQRDMIADCFRYNFDEAERTDDPDQTQWDIEELESHASRVAEEMTRQSKLGGRFYFTWYEGEYALFYAWEDEASREALEAAGAGSSIHSWDDGTHMSRF